jgi:hypothetical protein
MSEQNGYLRVAEFERAMQRLERAVTSGYDRIETKVDNYGERIVKLENIDRSERKTSTKKTVGWSSAAAGVVMLLVEAIKAYAK